MFVLYKISEEISLTPEQYRLSLSKATKAKVFQKYLYKICFNGLCIKINRIEIIDNVILRKDAEILVILEVQLILIKFVENQLFQGEVKQFNQKGIIVTFMNGLLEGRILPQSLHERTIYNFVQDHKKSEEKMQRQNGQHQQSVEKEKSQKVKQLSGKWILPLDSKKAFTWKLNDKVRFKIQSTDWQKKNQKRFADLIYLRADEEGLGPVSWWI